MFGNMDRMFIAERKAALQVSLRQTTVCTFANRVIAEYSAVLPVSIFLNLIPLWF